MKISMILLFSLSLLILSILLFLQFFLSEKSKSEKISLLPLESGFESLKPSMTLGSPFFFLAILFVLFDLELLFLFPAVIFEMSWIYYSVTWGMTMSLLFLTLALEWAWFGLKWQV